MTTITKSEARKIMAELELAAAHVLQMHGMVVGKVSGKYGDSFSFTVTANTPEMNDNGVDGNTTEARTFLDFSWEYGITDPQAALGATFNSNGRTMQMVGLNLRARKFPFIVREVTTGKTFKSPASIASKLPSYTKESDLSLQHR